jgi:hypothetical protein
LLLGFRLSGQQLWLLKLHVHSRSLVLSGVSTCCALSHLTAFDDGAHHERSG